MDITSFSESELIQQLDLYHYWEPFTQSGLDTPELRFHYLVRELLQKRRALGKITAQDIEGIPVIDEPILFAFDTLNQKAALGDLMDRLKSKSDVFSLHPDYRNLDISGALYTRLALKYWREFIKGYTQFRGFDKKVFRLRWENYYEILGVYEYVRVMMEKSMPRLKLYIGANDHSGLSQYGFVAARKMGLDSLYVQHAAVSDKFPPLRSTYALLDGEDAKTKYLNAGKTETQIRLIGAMKYDKYLSELEINKQGSIIGVCYSPALHDLEENIALCEALEKQGQPFAVRFHPATREEVRKRFVENGWTVSSPEEELSMDFILRCHTLISSDSNILLETILLKRRPIYFASTGEAIDYYGFVKNKVVEGVCFSYREVLTSLGKDFNLEFHRKKAKFYHDPLYTEWEGRSTELAVKCIEEMMNLELS